MKVFLFIVTVILMLAPCTPTWAQQRTAPQDLSSSGFTGRGQIMSQKPFYQMVMPVDTFRASPVLDLANPRLPKSLKEIVETAFAEFERITGSRKGWKLETIKFLRQTNNPEFKDKWCYIVTFTDGVDGFASFPVTVDGRLGKIVEEKAPAPKEKLPF